MRDPRDDLEEHRRDAPPGLFLSRRGNWFHDGDRVRHERLAQLLSGSVARDAAGGLVVTTGRDTLPFVAEDAPLQVRSVEVDDDVVTLLLSDQTREALGAVVVVGAEQRLRVAVRAGAFWALLTRSAGQLLEPFFVSDEHGDAIVVGARRWPLSSSPSSPAPPDWSAPPPALECRS